MNFNGIVFPAFNDEECQKVLSQFSDVVGLMAVLFAVQNPALFVPVDKDAKWGLFGPISGFFTEKQVDDLFAILPTGYADFFKGFASCDEEVLSIKNYLQDLPDLTEEELQKQAGEFDEMIKGNMGHIR